MKLLEFRIGTGVATIVLGAGIVLTAIYAPDQLSKVIVPIMGLAGILNTKRAADNHKEVK